MNPLKNDVPVQEYIISNKQVFVVRDDLCSPFPGNNNSKSRGVYAFLKNIDSEVVGVLDTRISRGGWSTAWIGAHLGKKVYIYTNRKYIDHFFRLMAKLHDATIIPIDIYQVQVGYYMMKKEIEKNNGVMLPLYLKLPETSHEVYKVALNVFSRYDVREVVVSVGTGTIASGIVKAIDSNVKVYGISHKNILLKDRYRWIKNLSGKEDGITLIKMNYTYGEANYNVNPPFPCDLYYDRWAWQWLVENISKLREPILFWNIGGEWHHITGLYPSFRGDGLTTREEVDRWIENRGFI
jgi:hypothetical protein